MMKTKTQIVLLFLLIMSFGILAALVISGAVKNINDSIYSMVASCISPATTIFMKILSNIGEWFIYIPFALLVLIIPRSRIKVGVPVALTLTVAAISNFLFKLLFHIDRPTEHRLIPETGYGFPSGHAMIGTAFIGICAYLFCKYAYKKPLKVAVIITSFLFLILMGFSRIYLGVHNPTDVIAGYICGAIIIVTAALILGSKIAQSKFSNFL